MKRDQVYLRHILDAITKIESYVWEVTQRDLPEVKQEIEALLKI